MVLHHGQALDIELHWRGKAVIASGYAAKNTGRRYFHVKPRLLSPT